MRVVEFQKARQVLLNDGLHVTSTSKLKQDIGFLGNNLTHGFIGEPQRVLATGVCFPDRPTLQSVLPLFAVKDLLNNDQADAAYIALPVFAYAGAGFARQQQYLEVLGLMRKMFPEDLGERVFIIPDSRDEVMLMKYKLANLFSKFVSDTPAKEKYPYSNLFASFETASYGSDIVLAALSEQSPATVIADFRQFESIHAGIRMGKPMGHTIGALLYTLINPRLADGKIREVSQDEEGERDEEEHVVAERSSLLYQASLLLLQEDVVELYDRLRRKTDVGDIAERIVSLKRAFFEVSPVSERFAQELEERSLQRMVAAQEQIFSESALRMHIDQRYVQRGVVYEYQ